MVDCDDPASPAPLPQIVGLGRQRLSPWVEVIERSVRYAEGEAPRTYHAVGQADYVGVLALTADDRVPLVRLYRPAIEDFSLELPAGLLEDGESPADCAGRELMEEAGFRAGRLLPLGTLNPDTGRLSNRLHGFCALDLAPVDGWSPEAGVERVLIDRCEFLDLILAGGFVQALHIALVGLAVASGVFPSR
ncbi:MAG: NUDIX hydrolase [Rhodospirillaceae bacterium]|nr:NUDIX hydrolase [Rhodospirillaceae bacterium]